MNKICLSFQVLFYHSAQIKNIYDFMLYISKITISILYMLILVLVLSTLRIANTTGNI